MLTKIKHSLLQLFYPHVCAGCGSDALPAESELCVKCIHQLPATGFERHADNPVEKLLTGRVPFTRATAQFYFSKASVIQKLMHQLKYRGNKNLGHQLGLIMGNQILESKNFINADALVPLPLYESRERKRGYNQAAVLSNGIAEILGIPVITNAVARTTATETQTHKSRIERWQNMKDMFILTDCAQLENKHLLLVDDVITTGATIEACATALLKAKGLMVSIVTLCYASKM